MIQTLFCIGYVVACIGTFFGGAPLLLNTYLSVFLAAAMIIGFLRGDDSHAWHQRPRLSSDPKAPGHTIFAG
jgi:hypothetical protein